MGGRGTFAAGNSVPYTYKTVGKINGVKVLEGINGKHGLPESAHSSTRYIKCINGTFKEMRFYDKNRCLYFELAYHPEKSITGNNHIPVLHYHTYDISFSKTKEGSGGRSRAIKASKAMKKRFKKYLIGVKL